MKIPFLDLVSPHRKLEEGLVAVFRQALRTGRFVGGPMVEAFEQDFAEYCNTEYCIGVSSGTDALRFAIIASGVKKNNIVVTVPNTFIATTEAITQAGAIPDFVDIDERTCNMDPEKLREYLETECDMDDKTGKLINRKLKKPVSAVIPVHLYGQMADMDSILELAEKYNILVIEDACQAHGAQYHSKRSGKWERSGSMGLVAAFSFYPGKNLGACGEAGAVTTNSEEMANKIKMLRDHGQLQKYYHEIQGYNGRLDAIQAGILKVKLKHLDHWIEKRRQVAEWYNESLGKVDDIITPFELDSCKSVYHLYVIRTSLRDELKKHLVSNGVGIGLHYPIPLHKQKAYKHKQFSSNGYPITEKVAEEILSLPIFPGLRKEKISIVSQLIRNFMKGEH